MPADTVASADHGIMTVVMEGMYEIRLALCALLHSSGESEDATDETEDITGGAQQESAYYI